MTTHRRQPRRLHEYETHLWQDVLPWWLKNAVDSQYGGVFTFWNTDGTQLRSTNKYTWSQGRWIWTLMACARLSDVTYRGGASPDDVAGLGGGRSGDHTRGDVHADQLRAAAEATASFLWEGGLLDGDRVANFLTREGQPTGGFTGAARYASVFADRT